MDKLGAGSSAGPMSIGKAMLSLWAGGEIGATVCLPSLPRLPSCHSRKYPALAAGSPGLVPISGMPQGMTGRPSAQHTQADKRGAT